MATTQSILGAIADIDLKLDTVRQLITDLKAQVAAGSPASQADLDAIEAALGLITAEVESAT